MEDLHQDVSVMESNSSDHSPSLSENVGGGWLQCWENEMSSLSGLNVESTLELHSLVEDKETAAKAVALVINSTRKGIVPLCADIASLLRAKRSLEKKLLMVRHENEMLQSSISGSVRTSHSTSPTPASLNSYDKTNCHDNRNQHSDRPSRPCSQCSQCSSTLSNSPKLEKNDGFRIPSSDLHVPRGSPSSGSDITRTAPPTTTVSHSRTAQNGIVTEAVVHITPDENSDAEPCARISQRRRRKNILPEIISEPSGDVPKIVPAARKISRETQCSFSYRRDHDSENQKEREKQLVKENSSMVDALEEARKEITTLKTKLKEMELKEESRLGVTPKFHVESECERGLVTSDQTDQGLVNGDWEEGTVPTSTPRLKTHNKHPTHPSPIKPKPPPKLFKLNNPPSQQTSPSQDASVAYLPGCKCTSCENFYESNLQKSKSSGHSKEASRKFTVSGKFDVKLNDHVVLKGERTGRIKYLGHVDNAADVGPDTVFVGLTMDKPVGQHDGFYCGRRYFLCHRDHGLIVPLTDIGQLVKKHGKSKLELVSNGIREPAVLEKKLLQATQTALQAERRMANSSESPCKVTVEQGFTPPHTLTPGKVEDGIAPETSCPRKLGDRSGKTVGRSKDVSVPLNLTVCGTDEATSTNVEKTVKASMHTPSQSRSSTAASSECSPVVKVERRVDYPGHAQNKSEEKSHEEVATPHGSTKPTPARRDKRWLAPYSEISSTPRYAAYREGPVV